MESSSTNSSRPVCNNLLPPAFFNRPTLEVARDLLGRELVRTGSEGGRSYALRARIVETEAYLHKTDPASHSFRGVTPRSTVMFGKPGTIYVYFIYGNYFMLNFVTEPTGIGAAVLIRAVEPLEGRSTMQALRFQRAKEGKTKDLRALTNGPAKLAMAFGIDSSLNGKEIGLPHLAVGIGEQVPDFRVERGPRIGIRVGQELHYRFYLKDSLFVSRKNGQA